MNFVSGTSELIGISPSALLSLTILSGFFSFYPFFFKFTKEAALSSDRNAKTYEDR